MAQHDVPDAPGMGALDLTRPGAEREHHGDGGDDHGGVGRSGGHGAPYSEAGYRMLRAHHRRTLWIPLQRGPPFGLLAGSVAGLAVLALSCGKKTERYGTWDRFVR